MEHGRGRWKKEKQRESGGNGGKRKLVGVKRGTTSRNATTLQKNEGRANRRRSNETKAELTKN